MPSPPGGRGNAVAQSRSSRRRSSVSWSPLETPSGDAPAHDRAAARIADLLTRAGAVVELVPGPGGSHVRARLDRAGSDGSTLVLAHLDTVWPAGETARQPFVVAEGVARGPGVCDMKGGLVALILAAEALRALDLEPPRPVVAAIVADEERGSPDGLSTRSARAPPQVVNATTWPSSQAARFSAG